MPNHLADSTSPYLLQHQHNPVDWYPWGPEALEKSVRESKPIFLSIGYAACHWCHVMEHESFENPTIAAILNEHFICIKVDREQRPDLDHIYMQTVQMLTGSGGWPMSVFLTPEMKPFYGGTYWPPTRRRGLPGFDDVLRAVINAWQNNPQGVASQSQEITQHLQSAGKPQNPELADLDEALLWKADQWLAEVFDEKWGGFGGAPKFPHAMDLRLLMQLQSRRPDEQRLHRIVRTLDRMADGGIYDHLSGGFARYSTDEQWLVPHFEKMLYDNALLTNAYLDGYLLTGNQRYRHVVCQTLEYVLHDLTDRLGGFYCTRDADSEGEEGKFYVWSREEILDVLGTDQGNVFCEAYGVTFGGNFEGKSILHRPEPFEQVAKRLGLSDEELESQLQRARGVLLEVRNKRVWPGLDDKVLCSWNALMIISLARAGAAFSNSLFVKAAENAAVFIEQHLTLPDGRLLHSWRQGRAEVHGFLEDYAYLAEALITLFECTGKVEYVQRAIQLVETLDAHFRDEAGGFFFTASDSESLIARYKDQHDGSVPSGNAMAAMALVRLSLLTGDERWQELAQGTLRQAAPFMKKSPGGAGQMLIALDHYFGPSSELVYVAPDRASVSAAIAHAFSAFRGRAIIVPTYVTESGGNSLDASTMKELVRGRIALQSQITLYECSQRTCKPPVVIESL